MATSLDEFKIRLPEEEARRLRDFAEEEDRTINSVVRRAVRDYLDAREAQTAAA